MSKDPYIDARGEVEANFRKVDDLLASYARVSGADAGTVRETVEELETTLELLELDLQDLDECVRVVEEHGDRWGIGEREVRERRGFVDRMEREAEGLRSKVKQVLAKVSRSKGKGKQVERYRDDVEAQMSADDVAEAERWEREEQQMLMRRQDDTLGVISGTLSNLNAQAGMIGTEVHEHSIMLDGLNTHVDSTQSRLAKVSRKMKDFIRRNEDTKSSWCIAILIIVLIILLVLVIIT